MLVISQGLLELLLLLASLPVPQSKQKQRQSMQQQTLHPLLMFKQQQRAHLEQRKQCLKQNG
jgi:hypothetical protein